MVIATLTPFSVRAQGQPTPEELQRLQGLADQVKAALQRGDLDAALRPASELMSGIVRQRKAAEPGPEEKLAKLEQSAPIAGKERFYALSGLAKAAFDAGEFDKAERYARELLSAAVGNEKDWNYGNAIFFGNMVLGRVALRRDRNVGLAKTLLMASATTTGSPQLNSFGPNMSLAKDLLAARRTRYGLGVLRSMPRVLENGRREAGRMDCDSKRRRDTGIRRKSVLLRAANSP